MKQNKERIKKNMVEGKGYVKQRWKWKKTVDKKKGKVSGRRRMRGKEKETNSKKRKVSRRREEYRRKRKGKKITEARKKDPEDNKYFNRMTKKEDKLRRCIDRRK